RRALGWLRKHGATGGERACHLATKDRQWKVPRRHAEERPAPVQHQLVGFAGGAGQLDWLLEFRTRLMRVVAQKVDCFAHLSQSIRQSLAAFADSDGHQMRTVFFEQV